MKRDFLESEEKLRLLFERSSDPSLLMDGYVYVDCNEAAVRCMGCPSKERLLGMRPWDLSPKRQPDGRLSSEKARGIIGATLESGTNRFEWLHRSFDGKELWMDISLTVIPVHGKRIMYTIWRDITERKKAEEALLASQFKLSETMDIARLVYWEVDTATGEFVFNDPFYAFYGTTAQREGGYRMSREEYGRRFVHPDDFGIYRAAAEKRQASREREYVNDIEHRIVRADGKVRYIVARIRVSRDASGRVTRYFGANQDITEQKRTEQALAESEERYRVAIESSNDGVAIVKGDRHIYVNRQFLAMFGYDEPDEILGSATYITVHPDDRERVMEMNRRRQRGESVPSRYEFHGLRRDGTSVYMEASAARIVYRGKPATLAYLRDITERRRVQEQLRQSQKMEAIGTLAGGVAHDFNNILAIILGNAELALDDLAGKAGPRENVMQIFTASKRARDLVKQILTFSRKGPEDRRPLRVAPLARETFKMLRASLPSTVRMELDIKAKSPVIKADPSQIQQILINLVTNAAYAMREKGGSLTVTLSTSVIRSFSIDDPDLRPGRYLQMAVRDTGVGMTPEVQNRIFEPFFTTKQHGQGTGMGLAVVYGIVKSHGGFVTVESAPGEGSTFTVFLPYINESGEERERKNVGASPGKEHILFVDDEPPLVRMTRQTLRRLGYAVTGATDSSEALRLFMDGPSRFDLVITDQTMPGMTGVALAKEMLKARPDLPILLCTGYSEAVSGEQARKAGIRELLMKPLDRAELAQTIRRVLDYTG